MRHGTAVGNERRAERGVALVAALVMLMLMSVVGLGLALTTSIEPAIASAHEALLSATYGAEAGLAIAVHELRGLADWNLALSGQVRSAVLESTAAARLFLPDGTQVDLAGLTNLANCGHASACTDGELAAMSIDRPWGANNPRWQLFGHARLGDLLPPGAATAPCEVIVWVADDPAELDGDPLHDSPMAADGTRQPGAGIVVVRAESFGIGSAHRVLTRSVGRPLAGGGAVLAGAWREIH